MNSQQEYLVRDSLGSPSRISKRDSFKSYEVLETVKVRPPSSYYAVSGSTSNQAYTSQVDKLREQNRTLSRQLTNARALLQSGKVAELESAHSENRQLRDQLAKMRLAVHQENERFAETINTMQTRFGNDVGVLQREILQGREQNKTLQEQLERNREKMHRMELKLQSEPQEVIDLKRQLNGLLEDYNTLRRNQGSESEQVRSLVQETKMLKMQLQNSVGNERKMLQDLENLKRQRISFDQQILSLNNMIRRKEADMIKMQTKLNEAERLIYSLKMEIESKDKQISVIESERDMITSKANNLKIQRQNLLQSQNSLAMVNQQEFIKRAREQNNLLLRQLQEKSEEIGQLKKRIAEMALQMSTAAADDQIHRLKDAIAKLEIENAKLRKYSKNPAGQFDEVLKIQITQAQKYKEAINSKTEQSYQLREEINLMRNRMDAIHREFQMERLKFTVEKKNLNAQFQIEKEAMNSQKEIMRKSLQAVEDRMKRVVDDSKKKDLFIQQYLVGRVKEEDDKVFIQNVFRDMHKILNMS